MKILLITFSDNSDHQDTLFGMYEELRRDGEFDTYLLAIDTPKVPIEKSDHTWLVACPKRPGICKNTFNFFLLFSILKNIKKENFDVIYFESLHIWNIPIMLAVKKKSYIYHVIHEVIPHEGDIQAQNVDTMNKVLVKLADTIIIRNKTYISQIVQRYGISENKVKYLELWRRYPDYTKPQYTKSVLFFGRINPYKGVNNLLRIVRNCPDINFKIVGRIDTQVEEIVKEVAIEKNVVLENGYVSNDEMREAFTNCDWVIVPYNTASQSGVIIDAYKYSRPVVAFNVGAISEQIEDKKSGFLIEAGDVEQFVEILKMVVDMDQEKYDAISKNAYEIGYRKYAVTGKVKLFKQFIRENL